MLQIAGSLLLLTGSIGIGYSLKKRLQDGLTALYQLREIFKLLQNEITYSKAALPEACRRVAQRVKEPYQKAFSLMYEDALKNDGKSFPQIWKARLEECLKQLPVSAEDKKSILSFGDCVGYMDPQMQAGAMDQHMHRLDLSVQAMEKEIANKGKVIMSLSIMGGLLMAVILL